MRKKTKQQLAKAQKAKDDKLVLELYDRIQNLRGQTMSVDNFALMVALVQLRSILLAPKVGGPTK